MREAIDKMAAVIDHIQQRSNSTEEPMSALEIKRLKDQIAQLEAREKTQYKPGEMRAIKTLDPSGRTITRYEGDPNACWDQFNPPVRYVRRLLTR